MDSRTIHQFQNYSSSWHSYSTGYWDLSTGPVAGSTNDLLHVWGHSFTQANQTLQTLKLWTESSIPIPIHPIYIPLVSHIYPIYPWYPHDIPMFQIPIPIGSFKSCSGPLGRMPVPRASWPRHPPHGSPDPYTERLRSDCRSGRASLPPLTEGACHGGRWVSEECWNEIHRWFFSFGRSQPCCITTGTKSIMWIWCILMCNLTQEVGATKPAQRRLPIGRLLQLIQGFLLAKGDSSVVAGDLVKFQAQSLAGVQFQVRQKWGQKLWHMRAYRSNLLNHYFVDIHNLKQHDVNDSDYLKESKFASSATHP